MKLHLNLSLRRALLAAIAAVSTFSHTVQAGVIDPRYDVQYYLDFCRNKGMFASGATNIVVKYADGTSITNNTIPLMPNLDSYGQTTNKTINGMVISNGGTNLISSQFVYGAKHVHETVGNSDVAFLTENASPNHIYNSANLEYFGTDSSLQRLTKLVTEVAYTPMADDAFMSTIKVNDTWVYRLGNGESWSANQHINTGSNSLGGVVNLDSIYQDTSTGEWYYNGWARPDDTDTDTRTPLDIGTHFGDSGSPCFAWDPETQQFLFIGSQFAGGCQEAFPNWYLPRYNPGQAAEIIDQFTVHANNFSGTEKITWGAQDAATGKGTLSQGSVSVEYTGKGTQNTNADTLGLTFATADTANVQQLELAGSVNMGVGAMTFTSGKWQLTEADAAYTFSSAGFDIQKGAELTWALTGTSNEEIRKVGEGTLTISGSGNNDARLVVGGGATKYNVSYDAEGNITGCTLGNAGETRLNRADGYAASSVRLEGGVAIIVLMGDNQFKTNSEAGDTFSFGNNGGLLNLNGHDLSWGVINQDGSGIGARIGNFTPLNENTPKLSTFTYTGTGTYAGCFMDEGADGAQLAVKYNSAGNTWTLTGNSTNAGGYTVEAGTMVLQGTNTPHVNSFDANDWNYASIETSQVTVKNGGALNLSHHAIMKGDVVVEGGGAFVLKGTAKAASESISGSLRQDIEELGITSFTGNVTLKGTAQAGATMTVDTNSPVTTTMKGNITGTIYDSFIKTGNGTFVVNGQLSTGRGGRVEAGGLVVKDATNFFGNYTNWEIKEQGFLAVNGVDAAGLLPYVDPNSAGVLALTADQAAELNLKGYFQEYSNLTIGAYGTVDYGTADATLTAVTDSELGGVWRLGGGSGTLNVHFLLTGENDLIIGNDYSSGTVHLTNTANNFNGDIYIKGLGNILTYEEGALGSARVALTYGNTLSIHNEQQLGILKEGAKGVLALSQSTNLDLSLLDTAIGAIGDVTYTGTLTVGDTYRFGGSGNLTVDTVLDGADSMAIDGQGTSGSSVTFARENAFNGDIIAGGGLELTEANSIGSIGIHAGHAKALANTSSLQLQKGATLFTDGHADMTVQNLSAETGSAIINNGDTASALNINITENKTTNIANGTLNDAANTQTLSIVKTGKGTLNMGVNSGWSGGLTIREGTVTASTSASGYAASGGIGSKENSIHIEDNATLRINAQQQTGWNLYGTILPQVVTGTGTIELASGAATMLTTQSTAFNGTVHLVDNTRLYVGGGFYMNGLDLTHSNLKALDGATIVVDDGSQARVTNSMRYLNNNAIHSYSDYEIAGTGFKGTDGTLVQAKLNDGALAIDCGATVWGNVTLKDDATISSSSVNAPASRNWTGAYPYSCTDEASSYNSTRRYGIINQLGGTIRGLILGTGKTLSLAGNEGMTITADSANTYGDLVIANGNGNNDDKFALRLDGGSAKSQTSTALGTGNVSLGAGLILRLAGTGTENNTDVEYTYANNITAHNNATLQSHNITNKLTGTVSMSGDTLNLETARGGVLNLAGGISGSGTVNVAANSAIILGSAAPALSRDAASVFNGTISAQASADITLDSAAALSATSSITAVDNLTLRLAGTDDYTLGGINVTASGETTSALALHFDFTDSTISAEGSYTTLTSSINAGNTSITVDLNIFEVLSAGDYTLISDFEGTAFTLDNNTSDNRLSLSKNGNGDLILTVAADTTRLFWSSSSTNHEWNNSDANWKQNGTSVAFSSSSNIMLDASGVAEGNSTVNREIISLSAGDQTVGTLGVLGAFYEINGSGKLSGTSMAIGSGGNLKLSADAEFGSVTVQDGYLDISEKTLTSDINAGTGAQVTIENNGKLMGNLAMTDTAEATVNQASVTGNVTLNGASRLAMDQAQITGTVALGSTGNIEAASGATISGTLTNNSTGNELTLNDGTIILNGAMNLDSFTLTAGKTATVKNTSETMGQTKKFSTLSMGDGSTLEINNTQDKTSDSAAISTLVVEGSAQIKETTNAGHLKVNTLQLAEGVDSAQLVLTKHSTATAAAYTSVFDFGSSSADAGNFAGKVVLNNTNDSSTKHSAFINLYNAQIFAKTVVSLNTQASVDGYLGLGISTDNVQIAGLESQESCGVHALLFSGYAPTDIGWNTGDGPNKNVDETARTLIINTEADTSYTFYGQVREALSLVKKGEGTQEFRSTSSAFNGAIDIQEGTLAFNSASSGMLTSASSVQVQEDGTLSLQLTSGGYTGNNITGSGTIKFSTDNNWNNAIKLGESFTGETYVTSGYLDLTGVTVGNTLRLANGVDANSASGVTSINANIVLEGASIIHANSSKDITYYGSITGDNGIFKSNGASSHTFMDEVDLAGFETHNWNTNTFYAQTEIDTVTINQSTVNFNGGTAISTATISGGTASFNGEASITTATISGGTANFNGKASITTANVNNGTVNIATNSLNIGTLNHNNGNLIFKQVAGNTNTSYSIGSINGNSYGSLTVDEGVTLNASSLITPGSHYAEASRALTVNGEMNLSGNVDMRYSKGLEFNGSGVLNIDGNVNLQLAQGSATNISTNQLNIGGNLSLNSYWSAGTVHQVNILAGKTVVEGNLHHTSTGASGSDRVALNIKGGSLVLAGGGTMSQGSTNISSGSLVQAGGTTTISNTLTMSGGELVVSGGILEITSAPEVSGGVMAVEGGMLKLNNSESSVEITYQGEGSRATLKNNGSAGSYSTSSTDWELSGGHLKNTASGETSLSTKLTGSSVENAGSGTLKITNSANTLTGVAATKGNVELYNFADETTLESLYIGADMTASMVTSSTYDVEKESLVVVSGIAEFAENATLNANLKMAAGSTLVMAEALQMGSTLELVTNGGQAVTLSGDVLAQLQTMENGDTLVLFTGVDEFTLTQDGTSATYTPGALTLDEKVLASTYFSNLKNYDNLYITYTEAEGSVVFEMIPEPATTTLSLLAIAALAARRRRKA